MSDEPQGSSPTASSVESEGSEGGGAGLNLDWLAREQARDLTILAAHISHGMAATNSWEPWGDKLLDTSETVLALVERVKALEAAADAARPVARQIQPRLGSAFLVKVERLRAALAAAGGPDGQ